MEKFILSPEYEITCEWKKTRDGFCHKAKLHKNGRIVSQAREGYLNRTWESYEYQTVIHKLIQHAWKKCHVDWTEEQREKYKAVADIQGKEKIDTSFGLIGGIAKLGELICDKQKDKNAWKKKMLGTIPGIEFPDNFDSLPEDEKEERLDKAIGQLN